MITLLIIASSYLIVLTTKALLARRYARRYPPPTPRSHFKDVTILQPVLGGDPALAEALTANLDGLPGAKFLWLLDEDDSSAWTTCRPIAAARPSTSIQLISAPPVPQGHNPKIFKLARAEALLETTYVVVLDDDTRLSPEGLTALVSALEAGDVSTALPLYVEGANGPGRLVAQFVNNQSILTYLPFLILAPAFTLNGMCYAMKATRLRELGGFGPLSRRLADDLAVARLVRGAGGTIRQTVVPVLISTTVQDWTHYVRLLHRWCVFAWLQVRSQRLRWRLAILAAHGTPPVMLWTVAVFAAHRAAVQSAWGPMLLLVTVLLCRDLIIRSAHRVVARSVPHHPAWSLASELLQPLHLCHALATSRIYWRSRVIDVREDRDFSFRCAPSTAELKP